MIKNCNGKATQAELEEMLIEVNHDKSMCKKIITNVSREMWITTINECNHLFTDNNQRRHVKQYNEIKRAIREIDNEKDRYAFVYFCFNFVRTPLYQEVVGHTHQDLTKDLIECILNVTFEPGQDRRSSKGPTSKTCINRLHGQLYNEIKQNILKTILPPKT